MRLAALYDIHGNLPALEAVLEDVGRAGVDEIVCGGDVCWGPFQEECIELLRETGASFLAGNCEREVLSPTSARDEWSSARLDPTTKREIATWPGALERAVEGLGRVLFCHATPADDEGLLTRITPEADALVALGDVRADVVVFGHTHVRFDRMLTGGPRLVNPGSVGLAYEDEPGAYWAVIGPDVELRRTTYDAPAALMRIESSGFPEAMEMFGPVLRGEVSAAEATEHWEARRGA